MEGSDSRHGPGSRLALGIGAAAVAAVAALAAPGMVHVLTASGTPAGTGVILAPSRLVLTSDRALQGTGRARVRLVLSGRSFPARLIGTDHAHGLGLLQIAGAPALRPIAVGNSRYLDRGAVVTAVGSSGLSRSVTLNIGNLSGLQGVVPAGGRSLTGLLVSTARVAPGPGSGGRANGRESAFSGTTPACRDPHRWRRR